MPEIIEARALRISLLPQGANLLPTIYKSLGGKARDEGEFQLVGLAKASGEEGELLNVVYAPDTVDGHGDFMSKAAVKDMAHAACRDGVDIDLYHDGKVLPKEDIFVAEKFLVHKSDARFHGWKNVKGEPVDLEGAFATVIKANCPKLRERIKSGELAQVSFEGPARIRKSAEAETQSLLKTLLKAIGLGARPEPEPEPELEMNKEEVEALVTAAVAKALKPNDDAPKAPEVDLTDPVAVKKHLATLEAEKGPDLNDPEAVRKHLAALELKELQKGVDFSDPEQVEAYLKKIAPSGDDGDDGDDGDGLEGLDETVAKRLKKAERRSNREPADAVVDIYKGVDGKLAKALQAGDRMAAYINGGKN